jgi:hypothetical protein
MSLPPELQLIDNQVAHWARWAGREINATGWPSVSMSARLIEWHERGLMPEKLNPKLYDDAPPEILIVDREVGKLPPRLRLTILVEYFTSGPQETKARMLKLNRRAYQDRLRAALWYLLGRLAA